MKNAVFGLMFMPFIWRFRAQHNGDNINLHVGPFAVGLSWRSIDGTILDKSSVNCDTGQNE